MTKLEKLDAGLEYGLYDAGVVTRKENALKGCAKFNAIDPADYTAQLAAIKELFGSAGKMCASSLISTVTTENIHVGKDFLTKYNVTILDIAPVILLKKLRRNHPLTDMNYLVQLNELRSLRLIWKRSSLT